MANKIILKKSSVIGKIPVVDSEDAVTGLSYGELAINYADGKLYYKTANNNINAFFAGLGNTGFTGSQGTTGFVGSQGVAGFTGSRGFTGSVGFTGSQGTTGFTGSQGIQGVTGFTGSQGIQGVTGFTGSQGIQGVTGFTGSFGTTGFTGSQGTTGFSGSTGFVGSKGDIGFTGSATVPFTQSSAPSTPSPGQLWWDTDTATLYIYYNDGSSSQWVEANPQNRVSTSSTTPVGALNGDLWWDTDTGKMYVYYDDGTSAQWVQATPDILVEGPAGTFTLNGNLVVTGDTTVQGTLYETSDAKLKTNVKTIKSAVEQVNKLRGVEFDWVKNGNHSYGLIAQDLEKVLPFLVQVDPTGTKTVNYTALIGLLIEAIKELSDRQYPVPAKKSWWKKFKEKVSGR